jgi:hypothetical protein
MRAANSPQEPRGRRPWLIPVALSIVIIGIAAFILARKAAEPEADGRAAPALSGRKQPSYKPKSYWSKGDGSAPAATYIRGTVYDNDGQPIVGARVTASTFHVSGNQSTPVSKAESKGDGRFELPLPDGSYFLTGEREGYGAAMAIAHSGDEVGIVLPRSGTITGHVRDADGQPVTRFAIDVISPAPDEMAAPPPFASRRFESADGSFKITELPDRGALLRVTAKGYAPALSEILRIKPGDQKTQDFALTAGCTVTGVVKNDAGAPMPDVLVNAELRRSAGVMGTMSIDATSIDESDSEGRFTLEGVPLGDLMVRAYDGTHAVSTEIVKLESCADASPIELRMTSGGGIHGLVRDTAGKPLSGVKITLAHRAVGFVNTTSDGQGRYRLDKLPSASMRIQAMRGEQQTTAFVTIPEGEAVEQDLVFSASGQGAIHGRVTAGSKPVAGIALTIIANEGNGVLGSRQAVTAADGSYQVNGLQDGSYGVLVSSANQMASAQVTDGAVATADIDISKIREPPTPQQIEQLRERLRQAKADTAQRKAEEAAKQGDEQPEEQPAEQPAEQP